MVQMAAPREMEVLEYPMQEDNMAVEAVALQVVLHRSAAVLAECLPI
jgi:hypothetical protein